MQRHSILGKLCLRSDPNLDRRVAAVLVYRAARAAGGLVPRDADALGSTLAGAALAIEAARRRLEHDPAGADSLLARASVQVSAAVDEVRCDL